MNDQRAYPTARVLLAFIAAPSLTGLILVLGKLLFALLSGGVLQTALVYYGLALALMLGGLMFYGIPAVFLGLTCVLLRLHRTWRGVLAVVVLSAAVCQGWAVFLASQTGRDAMFLMLPGLDRLSPLVLGACVSLVIVLLVLPLPSPKARLDDQ